MGPCATARKHLLANPQTGSPTQKPSSRSPAALPLPSMQPHGPEPFIIQPQPACNILSSVKQAPKINASPASHSSSQYPGCRSCQFGGRKATGISLDPLARGFS